MVNVLIYHEKIFLQAVCATFMIMNCGVRNNSLRPETHLSKSLVPKSQSLDASVRYLAGVMYFGGIQAALSHFYEFI